MVVARPSVMEKPDRKNTPSSRWRGTSEIRSGGPSVRKVTPIVGHNDLRTQAQRLGPRSRKLRSDLALAVRKSADPDEVARLRREFRRVRAEETIEAARAELAALESA